MNCEKTGTPREDEITSEIIGVAIEETLSRRGIAFKKSVVPQTNITQLFILDPDSNTVEFSNYPATPPFLD